ncbi:MAG: phage tail assembly chaperone [Alphaproteobacteria bacterium]|nr:phage tail assembly chaperone [Alphaproteobacteria bacterium]
MGLSPRDFWALSLPEWRALCEARFPAPPSLGRGALDQLMMQHPDTNHG